MIENKKIIDKSRIMTLTIKAVVLNDKNEVLILRRSKNNIYSVGKYDLPGGHIEENESLRESMIREIKEETGLDATFGEIIDVVEFPKDSPVFKEEKRGIRCICYAKDGEIQLSSEHDEYKWLPIEKAVQMFSEKNGFEAEKTRTILKAKEYLEMKNATESWKRCAADFENYKKRQAASLKDMISYANMNLISEILPVLDNFHVSTDHIPEDQKENQWVVGIMHIQKQLEKVLEDNGVSEIKITEGDEFDPSVMEAVSHETGNIKHETKNSVKKVLQKGYKIDSRVIRAARVIVK